VVIGQDGEVLNHHRKLMPTNPERMVWGFGDGSGLRAVDTPVGRIGALLCWENYMPLARFALYAQGIDIHIAPTYDSGEGWIGTLQHIAREGGCWVIAAGVALRNRDLPDDFPDVLNAAGHCRERHEYGVGGGADVTCATPIGRSDLLQGFGEAGLVPLATPTIRGRRTAVANAGNASPSVGLSQGDRWLCPK